MRTAIKIQIKTDSLRSGYRYYALQKGRELGIVGTISEDSDSGCFTIHAEARDQTLRQFLSILRAGTPFCRVSGILTIPDRLLNSIYFEILPTGIHTKEKNTGKAKIRNLRIGFFGL